VFANKARVILKAFSRLKLGMLNWNNPQEYWKGAAHGLSSWAWWAESMTNNLNFG